MTTLPTVSMTPEQEARLKRAAAQQDARRDLLEIARTLDELTYITDDAELARRLGPIVSRDGGIETALADVRRQLIDLVLDGFSSQRAAAEALGMSQPNISAALRREPTGRPDWLVESPPKPAPPKPRRAIAGCTCDSRSRSLWQHEPWCGAKL